MFWWMLQDKSAKITYTESTWGAPAYAWNPDFLEVAHIFVPDIQSEAHLRYWANCWDTLRTTKCLFMMAIEHGIHFFLVTSLDCTHQFRPIIVNSLDCSSAASLYGVSFQETTLMPMDNSASFCIAYLAWMNDMLQCPHARAFITEGGQLSWIARQWAGSRLV